MFKFSTFLRICLFVSLLPLSLSSAVAGVITVVDSVTHYPLVNASVFSRSGAFLGVCDGKGRVPIISKDDYPLTLRYLGYYEKTTDQSLRDTLFMVENVMELPEVVVETKKRTVLHLLAYVREYSSMTTLADTVSLFREKMVDFMVPLSSHGGFKGWTLPRVLTSKSYYRFTDSEGLDSVSDRCRHHFSWTDWMGLPPRKRLPSGLLSSENATDTMHGKYSASQVWRKNGGRIIVDADILADTISRSWVPDLSSFFRRETDFDRFNAHYAFENVFVSELDCSMLAAYSFNIESKGRGRGMFMFNRRDEPFYVTTYSEVYILDREYITPKEARQWEKKSSSVEMELMVPEEAPELQPSVLELVTRVNALDLEEERLSRRADLSNVGYRPKKVGIGVRALRRLKGMLGIDSVLGERKRTKSYNKFKKDRIRSNNDKF